MKLVVLQLRGQAGMKTVLASEFGGLCPKDADLELVFAHVYQDGIVGNFSSNHLCNHLNNQGNGD